MSTSYTWSICKTHRCQLVHALVMGLATMSLLRPGSPCYAGDTRARARARSTQPRDGYKQAATDRQEDRYEAEDSETAVEVIFSFSDRVQLTVFDATAEMGDSNEPTLLTVEPLRWDDTQWLIQLDSSILSDRQIEFVFVDDQVLVFTVSPGRTNPERSSSDNRLLEETISIEGKGEFIGALPAHAGQGAIVSEVVLIDDLANLLEPFQHPVIDFLLDDIERSGLVDDAVPLVVLQRKDFSADMRQGGGGAGGVAAAAACCMGGGACDVYGGEGCPSGTVEVSCPCASAK